MGPGQVMNLSYSCYFMRHEPWKNHFFNSREKSCEERPEAGEVKDYSHRVGERDEKVAIEIFVRIMQEHYS